MSATKHGWELSNVRPHFYRDWFGLGVTFEVDYDSFSVNVMLGPIQWNPYLFIPGDWVTRGEDEEETK